MKMYSVGYTDIHTSAFQELFSQEKIKYAQTHISQVICVKMTLLHFTTFS